MQRLFLFLYQYRAFLTFLFLEVLCSWLIIKNNDYQGAKFFNSANRFSAGLLQSSDNVTDYFSLTKVNKKLAEENAVLKEKLEQVNQRIYNFHKPYISDSLSAIHHDSLFVYSDSLILPTDPLYTQQDSVTVNKFRYMSAKVINNSTRRFNNYITINKGKKDGVEPGMGVIDNDGIVGKVKAVSNNFAVITSILHGDMLISAKIKRTDDLATVEWAGLDPYTSQLKYVPRHVKPLINDTIVTSGYNAVFPEGIPIGRIKEVEIPDDATFHNITITLASDLNELSYVYLIKNTLIAEQDSLETNSQSF
ncbi:MAG: rod shape-determining protein MreC [Fulvivirga sp.]